MPIKCHLNRIVGLILAINCLLIPVFGEVHQLTPVFFDSGSSLNLRVDTPVTNLVKPSGTPAPGDFAVFLDGTHVRPATTSEVFDFTIDTDTFVPYWKTSSLPKHWERLLFGAPFSISSDTLFLNAIPARNAILPSKTGNALKVLRVNAAEDDYELAAGGGGGGLAAVADDTAPVLGGDLDPDGHLIGGVDMATLPIISAKRFVTGRTAADATFLQFTPAANGSFEVSMMMNVTALTTLSTTMRCSYTNQASTVVNMIFPVTRTDGNWATGGLVTQNGSFATATVQIRAKAATTITLFTDTGTFTGVTYNLGGTIKEIPGQ